MVVLPKSNKSQKPLIRPKTSLPLSRAPTSDCGPHRSIGMPQERCVPHAIAWREHNPYQALPEHLVQSYPSLNAHTASYGPFWGNGIPEHLQTYSRYMPTLSLDTFTRPTRIFGWPTSKRTCISRRVRRETMSRTSERDAEKPRRPSRIACICSGGHRKRLRT